MNRVLASLIVVIALSAAAAQADIWQNVYRGLDILATPSGTPSLLSSDGTRVNGARSGRLRIVPSGVPFGNGYQLQFDRTFGVDSKGRPEIVNLGAIGALTLSGSTQFTAGYNQTGKLLDGTADLTISNLDYQLRGKVGVADGTFAGRLNVSNGLEINNLGFYTLSINVSNTNSSFSTGGLAGLNTTPTNFDVGPINIRGNIYADGLIGLLHGLGVDTTDLEKLFPQSPIDQINAALAASQQAASAAGNSQGEKDLASLTLRAVLGGDEQAASELVQGLSDGTLQGSEESVTPTRATVPEPGTLMLVAAGGSTLWFWRRRR